MAFSITALIEEVLSEVLSDWAVRSPFKSAPDVSVDLHQTDGIMQTWKVTIGHSEHGNGVRFEVYPKSMRAKLRYYSFKSVTKYYRLKSNQTRYILKSSLANQIQLQFSEWESAAASVFDQYDADKAAE